MSQSINLLLYEWSHNLERSKRKAGRLAHAESSTSSLNLFKRLRFYFLLFCGVHRRVNQMQIFLVLFLWNRRSKQAVVERNSSTLSCDSCGHKTRNPWIWTDCDSVWYVSYYSWTVISQIDGWVPGRRMDVSVRPSNKFGNDVDRDVDKKLRADTRVSLEQCELAFSMSEVWR